MPKFISFGDINSKVLKQNPLRLAWSQFLSLDIFTKLLIITVIIVLPIGFYYSEQRRANLSSRAAAPDQLETEGGVLGGNTRIVSDTSASGGQFVQFTSSVPTPTQSVAPTIPPTTSQYPPDGPLQNVTVPSVPAIPGYLAQSTDPTWNTKLIRVSNTNLLRNYYSNKAAWNSNQTRILLQGHAGQSAILDASNYSIIRTFTSLLGDNSWSNLDPNKIYGTYSGDNHLYSQNMTTDAQSIVHTFTGYTGVSMGKSEGKIDNNDRYVALLTTASGPSHGILVYDMINNTIVSTKSFSGDIADNATISSLGNYVIINYSAEGSGPTSGVWKYNRDFTGGVQLSTNGGNHGDVGLDASGNEIWAYIEGNITSYNLNTNAKTQLLPSGTAFGSSHISCRNVSRRGWCYLSVYNYSATSGLIGRDQIVAVKTDGSGTVEVFGFSYSRSGSYEDSPFAVPSRDGSQVLFGSDWGGGSSTYGYILKK